MTAQFPEKLILSGRKISMAFCPPLPDHHPRITVLSDEAMKEQANSYVFSTACWRQYIGTWKLKHKKFCNASAISFESILQKDASLKRKDLGEIYFQKVAKILS